MSWYTNFKKGTKDAVANGKSKVSSFWYDDYDTSFDYLEEYGSMKSSDLTAYKNTHNLYKLSSVRRAISNFVQIVTNKAIPVTFATKSDSKTDGEKVILSADVDDNFDVSVGLALHEGSHIILSDFVLLQQMSRVRMANDTAPNTLKRQQQQLIDNNEQPLPDWQIAQKLETTLRDNITRNAPNYQSQLFDIYSNTGKIGSMGFPSSETIDTIQALTNWIEDRRIDQYIYNSAPGYRDYYTQMYNHYFNDKAVTKGIASDEFTEETMQSYMFRIINLMNENTDLSKLKGLRKIYRMMDLKNVSRLKTTTDSLTLAIDVVAEILKQIASEPQQSGKQQQQSAGGDGIADSVADINEDGENEESEMGGMNMDAPVAGNQTGEGKDMLSKTAAQQLLKKFQKQKEFLNGQLKKKTISKAEESKLNTIQESGTELVRVGMDYEGGRLGKGVDCIVVKKITPELLNSSDFPFTSTSWSSNELCVYHEDEVKRGTMLGILLGKKLQIRSESRETVFSRLKKGKIDGRMIASLGYDNENVFYTNEVDQFKKGNLHISIDYSGSMSGQNLKKCIVSTVAIVKACQMARNINVQVSVRSTDTGGKCLPYVAMVYDSRRDTFRQFCHHMSVMNCTNTTPEGLCFEAIMKELIPSTNDTDSYFLNFSDGEPCFNISTGTDEIHYGGDAAASHTARQVKKMKNNGINVLSYFITDYRGSNIENNNSWRTFKKCYGTDSKYVNVENMFEVAKTMNELFLKKQ